uniref:5'-nucleotidase n=1 Tax=Trichuris muris TaxID=70415 RepID=A0A5S6QF36_TRIMR
MNAVAGKLCSLRRASSPSDVQILCSFDHAISKYCNREGKKMCTTQCVFDDIMRVMNMKQFNKVQFLRSKCAGIDQTAFMKNKSLATDLELYWKMMHETIAKLGVNAAQVAELISIANIELKDGFSEFARKTEQAAIPLIIFSTGISNVIGTLLLQNIGAIPTNVHIVGNEFFVDKMGCFYGVRTPLIHRYNKSYALLSSRSSLVDSSNSAKTFVLIGNSLENVSAAGRMRDKIALRIGFLNHDVDALKHTYMEKYDVVVTDPFSFAVPNKLLLSLLENC